MQNWNIPDGYYRIMQQRKGKPAPSTALIIGADKVDTMFIFRLQDRYLETGRKPYDKIIEELTRVRANNEVALYSVPEQIVRYEKFIATKQAILKALGSAADVETAIMLNNEIKEARAHIQELEEMKNSADAEESKLLELAEKIDQVLMSIYEDEEVIRRFIILATDGIEINEYSNHFATLTVRWSAPFQQVDVGYIYLPNGVHESWSDQDLADLKAMYPRASRLEIMQRFPTRSWQGIRTWAYTKGLSREVSGRNNDEVSKDWMLSLKDIEVMQKFGINTREDCREASLWDTDVSDLLGTPS